MPDDDSDSDTDSTVLDLGESLLNALGSGSPGSEWRDEAEAILGGEGEVDYDRLATAGIAAGEQVAHLRQQARMTADAAPPGDAPPVSIETRDIYDTSGAYAGTRIYVAAEDADAYLSASGEQVVVRTGGTGQTVTLPQTATDLITDDGPHAGLALYVAYPSGSVLEDTDTDEQLEGDVDEDTDTGAADG